MTDKKKTEKYEGDLLGISKRREGLKGVNGDKRANFTIEMGESDKLMIRKDL